MTNDLKLPKEQLDQIRHERAQLAEQIRMSQETIERSQELIRQMDEILAKAEAGVVGATRGHDRGSGSR
jgi:hypothetical protein